MRKKSRTGTLDKVQRQAGIHDNPARAGFVERAEDWVHSSAGDYHSNRKGLIELNYV